MPSRPSLPSGGSAPPASRDWAILPVVATARRIGILTAGGDSPGLNAAIRALGKAALGRHGMQLVGFRDGFRGLADDHRMRLDSPVLAGILTVGGTILGTSRDKPHRMPRDGVMVDMTPAIVATYERRRLDANVCPGGGGTDQRAPHGSFRTESGSQSLIVAMSTVPR